MLNILTHRGPDATGTWIDGNIGLGHRLLWTTPESLLEQQPLKSQTGELVLTADARIDNRDELIARLNLSIYPAEKITDADLILAAYEAWGEGCAEKLLGDFAVVIWDNRQQQLFCVRDHFGVKPFYYYYQPGKAFVFASEIKAILGLAEVPLRLNEVRIADYLGGMMEDKSLTSYQDILRLPPAHTLTMSAAKGLQMRRYWQLDPTRELKLNSNQEYAEAFREIFTEAVRCRLRSAFPVGCHLSGGLDSSSIACTARQLIAQNPHAQLHTFSNTFDRVPECNEDSFQQAVIAEGGLIPHAIEADRLGPLSEWEEVFRYEDEAFIGPNGFLVWQLNRATQEAGIRISLDGFDGDTTVSHGSLRFAELARSGDWKEFATEAKAISQHFDTSPSILLAHYGLPYLQELARQGKWLKWAKSSYAIARSFRVSFPHLAFHHGLKPSIPKWGKRIWHSLRGNKQPLPGVNSLINSTFAARIGFEERRQILNPPRSSPRSVREEQYQSLNSGLFTYTLELSDRSAAAFSIESRHPFMDKRLIEFCLALPSEQKLHQGWSRMVLRRAMAGILPPQVQWRGGKTDMTPSFLYGMLQLNRDLLEELVSPNEMGTIKPYVNPEVLQSSYKHCVSNSKPHDRHIMTVWRAVTLALWLRYTRNTL
jgi:asparagine synthase (glutamine-hydrolysing)